jgi:Holliday junction DNA helicase RuvA
MIASLRGVLQYKADSSIVLDVGGVGYEVHVTVGGFLSLPSLEEELFLHIYSHIKEDSSTLFGFFSVVEKETFQTLLHVSGIGPKLAIAVLSSLSPSDFSRAILADDLSALTKISGVGKKTAERMCLELKDKVTFIPSLESTSVVQYSPVAENDASDDAVSALMNLGYSENNARDAVHRAIAASSSDTPGVQELIREALRSLA